MCLCHFVLISLCLEVLEWTGKSCGAQLPWAPAPRGVLWRQVLRGDSAPGDTGLRFPGADLTHSRAPAGCPVSVSPTCVRPCGEEFLSSTSARDLKAALVWMPPINLLIGFLLVPKVFFKQKACVSRCYSQDFSIANAVV